MVKNLINFFIAVDLLLPQFLGLALGLLQLLEPKSHATNIGFIRLLIGKLGLEGTSKVLELWQNMGSADKDLVLGHKAQKRDVDT